MPIESRFILSPILSFRENQDKINAIIERSEGEDDVENAFEITEVDINADDKTKPPIFVEGVDNFNNLQEVKMVEVQDDV